MEQKINDYLFYHNVTDIRQKNLIFTWMLWNYEKLEPLFKNHQKFVDKTLFVGLVQEVAKDLFVKVLTNGGKYKACAKN